jgi:uncharacterized protein (TIGR02646 family)
MIRINKGTAPAALVAAKARYDLINNAAYVANRVAYENGSLTFNFPAAYRSDAVKEALNRVQHGKCCFSEAMFVNDDAHVEHFRPKGKVERWPNGPTFYPGYYWLAYDWSNLFFCKSTTNSTIKRNFFPLSGQVRRNRNHLDSRIESSILIDPSIEDPRTHIRFHNEEIKGITLRGKKNIKILNLRNPQLDEARRTKFKYLKGLKRAVELLIISGTDINDPEIVEMIEILRYSITQEAEFSSMAIDLLTRWPHL